MSISLEVQQAMDAFLKERIKIEKDRNQLAEKIKAHQVEIQTWQEQINQLDTLLGRNLAKKPVSRGLGQVATALIQAMQTNAPDGMVRLYRNKELMELTGEEYIYQPLNQARDLGYVENVERGVWKLTQKGREASLTTTATDSQQ